jgi:phosphonate transport system substrate-binding protein
VIFTTPTYYDYNWSVRSDMDPATKKKLLDAFLALKPDTPEGRAVLDLQRASKFVPTRPENYASIEEAAKSADLLK